MHLIVPFAGTASPAGQHALKDLSLPNLERLLARLSPVHALGQDEFSLSLPHELALADARGWSLVDGALPWAAELAGQHGLPVGEHAWALLTPVHLHAGAEQVSLANPAELPLDERSSRQLFDDLRYLFDSEGFGLHWVGPQQWLATHPLFQDLATASIDRAVGRNVDPWLPDQRSARLLRRLQNEVQMLLYTHPLNDQREAAGLPTVNSFWCSGCGRAQAVAANAGPEVDERLRQPALAEDWAAWREGWLALDAGPVAALNRATGPVQLTLCGERLAQRWEAVPRSLWQRLAGTWQRRATPDLLAPL
ncbi:MAG: hypothetical protein IPP44_19385 [Ideonella sp.]|nr:hypothetical protein [Ideonella sp.]